MKSDALINCLPRMQTPPYVSNTPDVYHRQICRRGSSRSAPWDAFLITCSDGMLDLAHPEPIRLSQSLITRWAEVVGQTLTADNTRNNEDPNLALALLRDCVGGLDTLLISRNLTVEMEERWMDDITIVVQDFT
jgi:pyruvate dehydrogenase phosphatase